MNTTEYTDEHDATTLEENGLVRCEGCKGLFAEDDDCGVQYRAPEEGYRVEGHFCHECAQEMNES